MIEIVIQENGEVVLLNGSKYGIEHLELGVLKVHRDVSHGLESFGFQPRGLITAQHIIDDIILRERFLLPLDMVLVAIFLRAGIDNDKNSSAAADTDGRQKSIQTILSMADLFKAFFIVECVISFSLKRMKRG